VHHGQHRTQEEYELYLALKVRSFHDRVEDPLSERGDVLPPLQLSTIPHDEISPVGERGGEGHAVAPIPSVDHPPMDSTDGVRFSRVGSPSLSCLCIHGMVLLSRVLSYVPLS